MRTVPTQDIVRTNQFCPDKKENKPRSETLKTWGFLPTVPLVAQLIPQQVLCASTVLSDLSAPSLQRLQDKRSSSVYVKNQLVQ